MMVALYLKLDKDHNGMLSKQELNEYNDGAFTELFFDRVFQVSRTYNGEMVTSCLSFVHSLN